MESLGLGWCYKHFHVIMLLLISQCAVTSKCLKMEQGTLKNLNNCFNTNIYPYLEMSGGQSSNLYLNVVPFLTAVLIRHRHLWQLKTVVFLHWCLIFAVL